MTPSKLQRSITDLILKQPFFAALLLGMELREDAGIPTFATNGDEIRYNPNFLETLTEAEITFVLAHEVLHVALLHMTRRGQRDPKGWNIAADYVINETLAQEGIGRMPKGGLRDSALVAKGGGTAEGVYSVIAQEQEEKQGPGDPQGGGPDFPGAGEEGGALDSVEDASGDDGAPADQADLAKREADLKVRINQALNVAKMSGKLSAGLERFARGLLKGSVPWREVLRDFLTARTRSDYSYSRPKRRQVSDEIILPSLLGEGLGRIAIAIDCSGSIDDAQVEAFASEIRAIAEDTNPEAIEILYFDSEILSRRTFERGEEIEIEAQGGGGTAFSPIFRALSEGEAPAACIVLTDLECSDFGPRPDFPVLWVSTAREEAPFGSVTRMKKGE